MSELSSVPSLNEVASTLPNQPLWEQASGHVPQNIPQLGGSYDYVLGFPHGGGACMSPRTAHAVYFASAKHRGQFLPVSGSWCNFNRCLAVALNKAAKGEITHFAMLHSDVGPQQYWVDILMDELERLDADLISAVIPIKDTRGLTTAGIGDPMCRWRPLKRFTMPEVFALPETFNAEDAGYPGFPLLHSHGCFLCDLRRPIFSKISNGELVVAWNFTQRIVKHENGTFDVEGESEDWAWSRALWEQDAKTYITRKVPLTHSGSFEFANTSPWGEFQQGDENTKALWLPVFNRLHPELAQGSTAELEQLPPINQSVEAFS